MAFSFRYPTFLKLPSEQLRTELDRSIPRIFDAHASLDGVAIKAPAFGGGFVVDTGQATVTGSKTGIQTRLTTVAQVVASIDNGATATNNTVTARVTPANASQIDLFCWMPTAAGNTTPIASTTPLSIHWWCSGTQDTVQK